jgi:hypothetical protein
MRREGFDGNLSLSRLRVADSNEEDRREFSLLLTSGELPSIEISGLISSHGFNSRGVISSCLALYIAAERTQV